MRRSGSALLVALSALLTLPGGSVTAAQPAATGLPGAAATATPDHRALVREIYGLWENAPNPVNARNEALYGDLREALKTATLGQLLGARQARTYEDVWAALPGSARNSLSVVPLSGLSVTPLVATPVTADLVYTPVTPCRIIDTRGGVAPYTGLIGPNAGNQFVVTLSNSSPQGGYAGSCGIPTNPYPVAVAINVTSAGQTGNGNLKVIDTGAGLPNSSLVNYVAGVNIANAAIVKVGHVPSGDIYIYSAGSASHAIVDVMGFFSSPAATALQTTLVNAVSPCSMGANCYSGATCPPGYSLTGGGYWTSYFQPGVDIIVNGPTGDTGWMVMMQNNSGLDLNLSTYAVCARTAGY